MISYEPLFNTMKEKEINQNYLRKNKIIDGKTFSRMVEGKSMRLETIERICLFLDVPIEKVVAILK